MSDKVEMFILDIVGTILEKNQTQPNKALHNITVFGFYARVHTLS